MTARIKSRLFCDLDGVVADFDRGMAETGRTADEMKRHPGAYLDLHPIPGAKAAIAKIVNSGQYSVFFATKPPTAVPFAYADKVQWVMNHFPELRKRIILTPDKGLLGCERDILIDDRPGRANCLEFPGKLITFISWDQALGELGLN